MMETARLKRFVLNKQASVLKATMPSIQLNFAYRSGPKSRQAISSDTKRHGFSLFSRESWSNAMNITKLHFFSVLPAIESIRGNEVLFKNGKSYAFDTIIFCTGFKRSTNKWLKGDDYLLNDDGFSKQSSPNNWKGKKGLYCVGLSRRGFYGAGKDAQNVANDIKSLL